MVLIAGVALAALPAAAEEAADLTEARKYFEAGKQAYKAGRFRFAAHAFEQAYKIAPRPSTIFSLAQALRRQYFVEREPRDLKRALDLFKQYLRDYPEGDRRGHAVEHIADLEPLWDQLDATLDSEARAAADRPAAQPTQLMISSETPGARAVIADGALAAIPVTATVEPGQHKVRVEAPGYHSRTVEAVAVEARLIVVRVDLQPKPAELAVAGHGGGRLVIDGHSRGVVPGGSTVTVPAGEHFVAVVKRGYQPHAELLRLGNGERREIVVRLEKTRQRRASYGVLGSAGGLLLAGGVTMGIAVAAQRDAQAITDASETAMRALTPDERDEHTRLVERRDRFRGVAYGFAGGALVAGGVGALLYLLDDRRPDDPRPVTVAPGPTAAGAGVSVSF